MFLPSFLSRGRSRPAYVILQSEDVDGQNYDHGQHDLKFQNARHWSSSAIDTQVWSIIIAGFCFTAILCVYFRIFSTLFVYLAWLLIAIPVEHVLVYWSILQSYKQARLNDRPRTAKALCHSLPKSRVRTVLLAIGTSIWFCSLSATLNQVWDTRPASAIAGSSAMQADNAVIGPVFIAADLYNSADLFPRFSDGIIDLVRTLGGPHMVYVSIYESNSNDGGKTLEALTDFRDRLTAYNVGHSIISGNSTHLGVEHAHERIKFLARLRNEALKPIQHAADELGRPFDKVLWLNDVYFDAQEIYALLKSNEGQYDLACAFDYFSLGLYDTWVTRDVDGRRAKPLWPYFTNAREVDALSRKELILVDSCWNGAASFDARWFTDATPPKALSRTELNTTAAGGGTQTQTHVQMPLQFRNDETCLSSECLLASLDMHRALPVRPVILMNPNVVTAYERSTFIMHHDIMRWTLTKPWHWVWERFISAWLFRKLTDLGLRPTECTEFFDAQWGKLPANASTKASSGDLLRWTVQQRWSK